MSSVQGRLVEAPGEPAALRSRWRRRLIFCALFAAATLVGRSAQADGAHLAVFWPASAVGLLWIAGSPGPRQRWADGALLVAVTAGLRVLTHMPAAESALLALAALVQASAGAWAYRVLQPEGFRLVRPAHVRSLALSSLAGALASTPFAAVAFELVAEVPTGLSTAQWLLRTTVSTFVVLAIVLRTAERRPDAPGSDGPRAERAALVAAFVVSYGVAFWLIRDSAVTFLVLPVAVWCALRRTTTAATVHVALAAAAVVLATWAGGGPWSSLTPDLQAVCAEAFIGTLGFLTLMLALYRDESVENARRAAEQADLLTAVFGSISDAVCVFDNRGNSLLRNPAADALLGDGTPVPREEWAGRYGFFHADGTAFAEADLPIVRALRGEAVDGLDLRLHTPRNPDGALLNVSAHPLPRERGAVWSGGVVAAFHDVTEVRAAADRVEQAHELLSNVLSAATEHSIIAVDTRGLVTVFNEGAERMLGWSAAEMVGRDSMVVHDPAELAVLVAAAGLTDPRELFGEALSGDPTTGRFTYVRRDGSTLPVSLTTSPMRDVHGELIGWIGMATDVSELENSEVLFRSALETAPIGVAMVATVGPEAGRLVRVNRSLCRFTGRREEDLLADSFTALVQGQEPFDELFADVLGGARSEQRVDVPLLTAAGGTLEAQVSATLVRPRGGSPTLLCLVEDVTDRRAAQRELRHRALHDPLTGLPNRALFHDRLEHAVAAATRGTGEVGLLYIDLDGFKAVNDGAGHQAGDDLLVAVAGMLVACMRPGDTVARLGGDEFAIVCPGTSGLQDVVRIGERVLEALRAPVPVRGFQAVVGASIGVRRGRAGSTSEELLHDADEAMYEAKRAGKGRVVVHSGSRVPAGPGEQGTGVAVPASHHETRS